MPPRRPLSIIDQVIVKSLLTAAVTLGGVGLAAAPAYSGPAAIAWAPCAQDAAVQCGTLAVPVDWRDPKGPRFDLAVARRPATDPGARVGTLVFGPGGPGDSGVDRVIAGNRFSAEQRRRFDIVSFDPRGVGRSNPVVCAPELLAQRPNPVLTSQSDFDALLAYNQRLREDCRARTGPVYDHADTLSTVKDLDAIRAALGEAKLTYHGSSYGTLLGEQYAETFPHRVRALVLESVVDHSVRTRDFLDTQAVALQDSFEEFVAWCDGTTACALQGNDVRAVWADLLARADRGELRDASGKAVTAFDLVATAHRHFYGPDWPGFATKLAAMNAGGPATVVGVPPLVTAVFCADWSLPVRDYKQYASYLRRTAESAPDVRYPASLYAAAACLGWPQPVANPQHTLKVRGTPQLLLLNTLHDPASGYNWATNVARQLGDRAVLLTYEGWGHGAYTRTPCVTAAVDTYLLTATPPPTQTCPASP
ncbi:alpha/beta hydrolase [Phytohabitans aurantiacus]|uniref:Peptidase n=1 Tax=Phytohabitans aurantiacus TaxID=3016789 RepID=A0ABQ5R2I3_9ACTN|nr:peptidase [Phytohabitans aurantiacus]